MKKNGHIGMPIGHRPGFVPVVDARTGNPLVRVGRVIHCPEEFFGGPPGRGMRIVFRNLVERSRICQKCPFFLDRVRCYHPDTGTSQIPDGPDVERISLFHEENLPLSLDDRDRAPFRQTGLLELPDRRPGGHRHLRAAQDTEVSETQRICPALGQGNGGACGIEKAPGCSGSSGFQERLYQFPESHIIIALGGQEEIQLAAGVSLENAMKIEQGVGRRIGDVGGGGFCVPRPGEDRWLVKSGDIPDGRQVTGPGGRRKKETRGEKNPGKKNGKTAVHEEPSLKSFWGEERGQDPIPPAGGIWNPARSRDVIDQ
jgi:hypothetical protein